MHLLEINYRSVFETLPGLNVLLLPDAPDFTVIAMSNAYATAASLNREDTIGHSFFTIGSYKTEKLEDTLLSLADSLQHVFLLKEAHTFDVPKSGGEHTSGREYLRFQNTPVLSADGELQYIIHSVSHIALPVTSFVKQEALSETLNPVWSFMEIINQSPVAMGILRGKSMVLEIANTPMLELWGKGREIIGLPITEGLPEIINQPFPELLQTVYETGVEFNGLEILAYLKKQGVMTECYFNFVYSPYKDSMGNVTGIVMVASDVTSLVKAKKALEESEKRYRDLIANATVATAIYVGEDMVIQLANDAMLKLWGKDASIIGKPLKEAIPELDGQPFSNLLRNVYKTGITYHSTEDRADLRVDGHLQSFYFNFTYKALRDSSGNIYGILNMAVDISATVNAKIEIKNAEEQWRIALQSAELGTWDYYSLNQEFNCSVRTKELFGLSGHSKPTFEDMINAVHPRDREKVRMEMRRALQKGATGNYRVEYSMIGIDDHKERWQRATGQAFHNEEGIAYRLTGTVLDITERKRVEEALEERVQLRTIELLEANKELERSNLELEQYAYVASHDLQEPLRKILVYTDLMKRSALKDLPAENFRLEKVIASAHRMSHLINDLLNFSRLLKAENIFSEIDLNLIVNNVIDDFELKIQETGAVIHVEPLPGIEASPQQMNQMFYNLISNALKFRKDNQIPEVWISARKLTEEEVENFEDLNPGTTYFEIQVKDNGIGFNVKYSKHVFEIFKRLHTRARYEGTGIGLALCRKIARNHRGDIQAESTEGVGSIFHVFLPEKQHV